MSIHVKTIFEEFEQNVHELAFYADIVQKSYEKYLSEIEEQKKSRSNMDFYSSKWTVYFDILNQHEKMIGDLRIEKTLEQTSNDIFFHYNKQMQWFLVEAYEMYEKFIDKLYAVMGCLDNNFWNTSDFGEIQLNDIANKNENWFFEQAKKKKEKPYSIIKVFEKRFDLKEYFDKKTPNANYDFLMQLISEFRHAIVHDKGFLDKTVFINKLFKKQVINEKESMKKHEEFINVYYGKGEYENLICLTTIKYPMFYVKDTPVLPVDYNRREMLTRHILSYGYLLTQLSIQHLDKIKNKR